MCLVRRRHIYDTAMKAVGKEPVIAIAGSDECKKLVEERFEYLEAVISTGKFYKTPRKLKKRICKDISARFNLCVIVLNQWDDYKQA